MRRAIISVLVSLLAALGLVGLAGPAQAVGPTCVATSTVSFSPGLTFTPTTQTIGFDVQYSGCVTLGRPDIVSGTRQGSYVGTRSCLSVLPPSASGTFVVTWNTGETSTVTGTSSGQDVAGQSVLTLSGTVTAGLFVGSSFTEVITQASLDLTGCLIPPGITSQSGVGAVTLL